jgi:hypothetical protein
MARTFVSIVALCFSLASPIAFAQRTSIGDSDCGKWLELNKDQNNYLSQSWLVGFLTALNMTSPKHDLLSKIKSPSQIYFWIDNYCRANPLSSISIGAMQLHNELNASFGN